MRTLSANILTSYSADAFVSEVGEPNVRFGSAINTICGACGTNCCVKNKRISVIFHTMLLSLYTKSFLSYSYEFTILSQFKLSIHSLMSNFVASFNLFPSTIFTSGYSCCKSDILFSIPLAPEVQNI